MLEELDAELEFLAFQLTEASDFVVRCVAAITHDKDGRPTSKFLKDPKDQLHQAFAKCTATEQNSKRNLSADAKRRDGFQKRLKQYENALTISRNARGKGKKKQKPAGELLKFPVKQPAPEKKATGTWGKVKRFFGLAADVQTDFDNSRLLVEDHRGCHRTHPLDMMG